jgi:peptide deformylase
MSNLEIKIYPNPVLQKVAKKIDVKKIATKEFQKFLDGMAETMIVSKGIGLAAPQVGRLDRVFVVNTKDGALPWINPKIVTRSIKKDVAEEGCLSIPKVYGKVKRAYQIKMKALDKDGVEQTIIAKGLYARVIQHEIDHLDGVLFIEKALEITSGAGYLEDYESQKK